MPLTVLRRFAFVFGGHVEKLMVERMEHNKEIFARYMSDPGFRKVVNEWLSREVYGRLLQPPRTHDAGKIDYGREPSTSGKPVHPADGEAGG